MALRQQLRRDLDPVRHGSHHGSHHGSRTDDQPDELKKTDEQLQIEEVYKCEVVFISKVNLNKPVIIKEEIRNDF